MYKLKTHKSSKKRYKINGSGNFFRKKSFKSHLLQKKSSNRKRYLSKKISIKKTDLFSIKKRLPYLNK